MGISVMRHDLDANESPLRPANRGHNSGTVLSLALSLGPGEPEGPGGPLGHSMTAAFGSKPETLPDPPKSPAPLHSKRSLAWYRTSLGLAGVSVAYLYLAD
jgi:hypothetical protein